MIRSVLPFLICLSLSEAYLFNHFSNDFKGLTSKCGFKPYIVNVEGIVGTGKSTFLRFMRDYPGVEVLPEPVDKWTDLNGTDLLRLVFDDPQRWGLAQESYVQLTMFEETIGRPPGMIAKVMERSIYSARNVFIESLRRADCISQVEFDLLDKWYRLMRDNFDVKPDMIVYLQSSPEIVYERIKRRGRPEEANLTMDFLYRINRLHEDWLVHRNTTFDVPTDNIVVINTSHPFDVMVQIYKALARRIWKEIEKKHL